MSDIVTKHEPAPPSSAAAPVGRREGAVDADLRLRVRARTLDGQQKRGEVWTEVGGQRSSSVWVMLCDEGARSGGSDTAPAPLSYFSAAIAF